MGIYYNVWGKIPFFTSLLISILPIFYILAQYQENFFENLCNDESTILKGQLYRLFTSGLAYPHLYSVILTMILLYFESSELERVIGTATYLIHLTLKTIILNFTTWIFALPIYMIFKLDGSHRDFGFFPCILTDILVRSYYRPNELRFKISNKLYPLFIMLAFLVTNIEYIPFSLISVFLYAYIEIKYFNGMMIRFYKKTVQKIENCVFFCQCCRNSRSFIKVQDCNDFLFKRSIDEENVSTEHLQEMCEQNNEEENNNNNENNEEDIENIQVQQDIGINDKQDDKQEYVNNNNNQEIQNADNNIQQQQIDIQQN